MDLARSFVRSFLFVADSLGSVRAIAAMAVLASGCASSHGRDELDAVGPRDAFAAEVGALDAPRDVEPDPPDATRDVERDPPDAPSCSAEVCDGIDQDCDGLVDDGAECTIPGASAACVDGACRFVACDGTHTDCNGDVTDGCEVALHDDRENCSACGAVCGMTETCEAGACVRERIVDVAPGGFFSCALLGSGRVLCWGTNEYGSFGTDDAADGSPVPVEILGLPRDLVALADSQTTSGFGVTAGGDLWGWGSNTEGELGIGVMSRRGHPAVRVPLPVSVAEIHTASEAVCAVTSARDVWCWGDYGGSSPGEGHPTPARVELPGPVTLITGIFAAGWLAQAGGSTVTWGTDAFGIRGAASVAGNEYPVTPWLGLPRVQAVDCSGHCCAILPAGGGMLCWGSDYMGALGNGLPDDPFWDHTVFHDPDTVLGPRGAVEIVAVGEPSADLGACARYPDGSVECWGGATASGLGRAESEAHLLELGVAASAIHGGHSTGCARLVGDTRLRCWGRNDWGELGDGSIGRPSAVPVAVVGFE